MKNDLMTAEHRLILDAQAIVVRHVYPGGPDAQATVNELLRLLDGPRWREVEAAAKRRPPAPGYYYQRAERSDPWDMLQVTSEGEVLALRGERYAGAAAVEFMSEGEWLAVPIPPGGELAE